VPSAIWQGPTVTPSFGQAAVSDQEACSAPGAGGYAPQGHTVPTTSASSDEPLSTVIVTHDRYLWPICGWRTGHQPITMPSSYHHHGTVAHLRLVDILLLQRDPLFVVDRPDLLLADAAGRYSDGRHPDYIDETGVCVIEAAGPVAYH
jgi:hypothetical protein